jgi:hypothetical protein
MVKEVPLFVLMITCIMACVADLTREFGRGWGFQQRTQHHKENKQEERLAALEKRVAELEQQLNDRNT